MANKNDGAESHDIVLFNKPSTLLTEYTYTWKIPSSKYPYFLECTDEILHKKAGPFKSEKKSNNVIIDLFKLADGKTSIDRYYLGEYFKEVFEDKSLIEGYYPVHKYYRLIIPIEIHNKVLSTIKEFKLQKIGNLIFETVAIAQNLYIQEVTRWDEPKKQKLIKSAKEESKKVIKVIERLIDVSNSPKSSNDSKSKPHLDHIKFVYNSGDTIKIEHELLCKEFIVHMKDYYDNLDYKDWKKELTKYDEQFKENIHKSKFKYRLAKSYYNLLENSDVYNSDEKLSSNQLMLCISKLLEYSLISIDSANDKDKEKIKIIRNWIKRYDLKSMISYSDLTADLDLLKRYFDPIFIDIPLNIKKANAFSIASYICERFNIHDILPELNRILVSILEANKVIWYKLISNEWQYEIDIPDYITFITAIDAIKAKKKITSIKLNIDGVEGEHLLTHRLPLFLIEESIRAHYINSQVEFDVDIFPIFFEKKENGNINVNNEYRFSLPHERYLVRLTHSLYNFLKEIPSISETDNPNEEIYYEIIAIIFMKTKILNSKMPEERSAINKVKHWHLLNPES